MIFLEEGSECKVWLGDDDYVYKDYCYRQYNLEKKLNMLNSLPEYENEILCEGSITKQKKLRNWKHIVAKDPNRNWDQYMRDYLLSKGYEKQHGYYCKNGVCITDIYVTNFGEDDNGEYKIIDADVKML